MTVCIENPEELTTKTLLELTSNENKFSGRGVKIHKATNIPMMKFGI